MKAECDYEREADAMRKFRQLSNIPGFYIPFVVDEFSTKRILTAEFVEGVSVDACINEPQAGSKVFLAKF